MKTLCLLALLSLSALSLRAQTNTTTQVFSSTNAFLGTSLPDTFLNILPAWDPTLTNTFLAKELEFEFSPAWKSVTASGLTPFFSFGGDYMFTKHWGLGGEVIALGNAEGNSVVDATDIFGKWRVDRGNIAGYVLLGVGRDWNTDKWEGQIGPGIAYRYKPGLELFFDTRWCVQGTSQNETGFLTRVGMGIHF